MSGDTSPFEAIGGAPAVRALAQRFYALVDADPAYAELRALHGADLAPIAESLAGFLTGWLGGPRDWFASSRGCIFSLHGGFAIGDAAAAQWTEAMARTIRDQPGVEPDLAGAMIERLGKMAQAMVNARAPASAAA
ncbi:globin [Sphingomonas canadensis]|uniref:Globin n=1 Tax=Sphingomonas canadensis TaxID=1219257 RepID=A0ABW3HAE3_9SPHN|nr:globin [Sphingomonas canadensis]MCW3838208.1 globin [Sphingomonas canadensis]